MELSSKFLQSLVLIVIISVYTVESMYCYQCNSGNDYDGTLCETGKGKDFELFNLTCPHTYNYTRCRKTIQTVGNDIRTVRSCATPPSEPGSGSRCIDRTGTTGVRVKYCECENPGCNGSSGFIASILLVFGLALSDVFANAS